MPGSIDKQPLTWEAADTYLNACGTESPCQVHRAWVLIGLNADQADQTVTAVAPDLPDNFLYMYPGVGFVDLGELHRDIVTEYFSLPAVVR